MGRAIDRLPVDFQEPREPRRPPARQQDIHNDAHHTLIAQLPEGHREIRDEKARRYLRRKGFGDLIDVLGLADTPTKVVAPKVKLPNLAPAVRCPRCEMPPKVRCVTSKGVGLSKPHVARLNLINAEENATYEPADD